MGMFTVLHVRNLLDDSVESNWNYLPYIYTN